MASIVTVKPDALKTNGRIGIMLPASAPLDTSRLTMGIDELRRRGLTVVHDEMDSDPVGYLGAPDPERAARLNELLARDDLSALISVRGGYGVMRILDALDYIEAAKHPKLLVGYSDITALQFAFYTQCGWTSVQGPMAAVEWPEIDESSESQFWRLVGGECIESIAGLDGEHLTEIVPGVCEGVLLGGNLAAIVRLVGTPYLPPLDGSILYLEDVGEAPYRIDALLAQLKLAGVLGSLGGVVLGTFMHCDPDPDKPSFTTREVLLDYFSNALYPVAEGLVFGHIPRKVSMPFGVRARLSVSGDDSILAMLEPVTTPRRS